MKKTLSFLFFFFLFVNSFAQLDREHWFAPMIDRTGNPNDYQKLYFSTNRTTPFPVRIYNNNILIGTVNISKGNPQKFDVNRNFIITTSQADLFTPITKGLYVEADFPFYANLRFSVFNHAEIITSKGIPSTGTTFYTAMAPITVLNPILNFQTSILATEDNTTVTVSGYDPTVSFSNGTTGATNPTITFTLNKGQSYIIDGIGNLAQNSDSFIGAKIVANKPVNVTNGNFNGQYSGNFPTSSDILMDQSIPINNLGNEFALVKGNGPIGSNTESVLVIAIQDNTQIFVNGAGGAIATIDEGEYFLIPETNYQLQGSGHYNLYLETSNNAYVYQLLAGVDNSANSVATGGFNFIPALNCYLPKKIDELGLIDENEVHSNGNPGGILNVPTKLNLVTEVGANVLVNGLVPPATSGPFPMTGNANWVTYGIPNVSGNITVTSDQAITAGINAGSDAVGYGGFFAGFPTTPVIITSGGTCFPGITLTVDPIIYNAYQWFLNGNILPGETNPSITPTTPGFYHVEVTMGSCAPLLTEVVKVEKCMVNTNLNYTICETQNIQPVFSSVTIPQNIDLSTLTITSAPNLGTATINPTTGEITYTANNPGVAGTDTFVYTFCGDHPEFPECETVTVTINIQEIPFTDDTIYACEINGQGSFDLTTANITTFSPVVIEYYPTFIDAQNQNPAAEITNTTNYPANNGTVVYALIISPIGCTEIAEITLELFPLAVVVQNFTGTYCDNNLDGSAEVDLSTITNQILPNANYFTVNYYDNLADANAGNTNTLPNNYTFTSNLTIYIRVDSPDGCATVIEPIELQVGPRIPVFFNSTTQELCDNDLDGFLEVNLSSFIGQYTTDPNVTATFHNNINDAQNGLSPLSNLLVINGVRNLFIRFESPDECANMAQIQIIIKTPKNSETLEGVRICSSATTTLDAGPGFEEYLWSTGATTPIVNVGVGDYWVDLTFNGCIYRQYVTVAANELPEITEININNGTVTIIATGGTPPYQYSLNGVDWQDSNVFLGVARGSYIAYVRDRLQCDVVEKEFFIINLINAISPNNDGINDNLNYSDLLLKDEVVFRIFDRYNQELFSGTRENKFTWDGKYKNGSPVPTATYWYILEWTEPKSRARVKYTSWLLVKNRQNEFFQDKER